jgi:hypothetical protein
MTLDALIMLAGAFIIIEPQLGFPTAWDTYILFAAGVIIVGLGIAVRRRGLKEPASVKIDSSKIDSSAGGDVPRVQ